MLSLKYFLLGFRILVVGTEGMSCVGSGMGVGTGECGALEDSDVVISKHVEDGVESEVVRSMTSDDLGDAPPGACDELGSDAPPGTFGELGDVPPGTLGFGDA